MLKTGFCSVTFRKLSTAETIDLAAQSGLNGIEWGGDVHVPPTELDNTAKVVADTKAAGLEVLSYGSYYRLGDGAIEGKPKFSDVIASAKILGVNTIRIWGGNKNREDLDDAAYNALVEETLQLADAAKKENMKIAFEFHGNSITNTCDSAIRFMEDLKHDNVGLYWQVVLADSIDENIASLKRVIPYLINVHVFNYFEKKQQLLDAYDGLTAWKQYLDIIRTDDRDHNILLEFTKEAQPENFLHDAKVLNSLIK